MKTEEKDKLLLQLMLKQFQKPTYSQIVDYIYKTEYLSMEARQYNKPIVDVNFDIWRELKEYIFSELHKKYRS